MITPSTVHVDQALSQISVAYTNPAFVAEELFPVVPVDKQHDVYFKFSKQHFRARPDAHASGADVNEIEIDLDARQSYFCDGHALDLAIPDPLKANADPGADLDIETTLKVVEMVRLNEEINAAAQLTAANITQNSTLAGTSQWSDYVNSDPIAEVEKQKETIQQTTGMLPNRLLLSRPVFRTLRNHPRIIDRIKYTVTPPLSTQQLADAFEVEKIVLAQGLKNTATMGQLDSLSYIFGKNALLFYRPPQPGKRVVSLGYTFVWMVRVGPSGDMTGDLRPEMSTGGFIVRRYRWERRRAEILGVDFYYAQALIEANCGYLWLSAVA